MNVNRDVILVNENDIAIGFDTKQCAHIKGEKHRALSVFVLDEKEEKVLLQKRSISKYHSGGLWSNSCCSHQYRGESIEEAVNRCLKEELGVLQEYCVDLKEIGAFSYYSNYGIMKENEYDHVFVCIVHIDSIPRICQNRNEVEEIKWVELSKVKKLYDGEMHFTSWFQSAYSIFEDWYKVEIEKVMPRTDDGNAKKSICICYD